MSSKRIPTDDVSLYHKVIEIAAGIPVLVRGGGKAPDQEILERTETLIQQGAAGDRLRAAMSSSIRIRRA